MNYLKIFFIPGLGFDHRIFSKLDLAGYLHEYLDWIEPEADEMITDYALRISAPIEAHQGSVVILGHSFGGVMAQEIARLRKVDTIILISSIRSRKEHPPELKMIAPLALHKLFSKSLTRNSFPFWKNIHGYQTKEEQALFLDMVNKNSDHYLQWALKTISEWDGSPLPHTRVVQIHGGRDLTFPFRLIKQADYVVKKGGHFMVYKNAAEVSRMIREALNG